MLFYVALVLFCCLYKFSSTPNMDLGKFFLGIRLDRYAHFIMFFPYPFIAWLLFKYNRAIGIKRKYIFAAILISGLFFASLTEASQELLTSYRDSDPFDFIANITGISTGTLTVYLLTRHCRIRASLSTNTTRDK